ALDDEDDAKDVEQVALLTAILSRVDSIAETLDRDILPRLEGSEAQTKTLANQVSALLKNAVAPVMTPEEKTKLSKVVALVYYSPFTTRYAAKQTQIREITMEMLQGENNKKLKEIVGVVRAAAFTKEDGLKELRSNINKKINNLCNKLRDLLYELAGKKLVLTQDPDTPSFKLKTGGLEPCNKLTIVELAHKLFNSYGTRLTVRKLEKLAVLRSYSTDAVEGAVIKVGEEYQYNEKFWHNVDTAMSDLMKLGAQQRDRALQDALENDLRRFGGDEDIEIAESTTAQEEEAQQASERYMAGGHAAGDESS
ncbi:hypothetical protein JCM3774_000001, partial [Rhodotorula dairenensis]